MSKKISIIKEKKSFIVTSIALVIAIVIGLFLFLPRQDQEKQIDRKYNFIGEELIIEEEIVRPEKPLAMLEDRSLVRVLGEPDIFWIQNEKRYLVLGAEIIALMRTLPGWEKIHEIPSRQVLEKIPQAPNFIAPDYNSDNILIRMAKTDHIFLIQEGKRIHLTQEKFRARNYNLNDVIEVTPTLIKKLPFAPPIKYLNLQEAATKEKIKLIGSGKYFEDGIVLKSGPHEKTIAINIKKGDVLLSKVEKQPLVVTQNFEIFVPKGEKITLEGVWVACIDRFKDWPSQGEILDVAPNLRDWGTKSATLLLDLIEVIDKKGFNRENFAQAAIWRITDQEPVDEEAKSLLIKAGINPEIKTIFPRLSNPDPPLKTTFVIPPELSLLSLVAKHIENCPKDEKKADKIICRQEMELATKIYLKQEIFPGTIDQIIDSKIIALLLPFYLDQKPIDQSPILLTQNEINKATSNLVKSLRQRGVKIPSFQIKEFRITPYHIIEQETATFKAIGRGIKDIRIKIFDVREKKVFQSERMFGNLFDWHLRDNQGKLLPNGFYSYKIEVRGFEQESYESPRQQLIIRL